MNKLELVKAATKFVVGTSVSFCAANVIRNNVTPTNVLQSAEVVVGSIAIGVMVAEQAESWTDKKVDAIHDWYVQFKTNQDQK